MATNTTFSNPTGSGNHDGQAEGDAWSPTEAADQAVAGDLINHKGNFTLGAQLTMTNAGSSSQPIILRGYTTNIGDGDQGWTPGGGIITTKMPTINVDTYNIAPGQNYWMFRDLNLIGAKIGGPILHVVNSQVVNCRIVNSGIAITAYGLYPLTNSSVSYCDIATTGSTSGHAILSLDGNASFCRLTSKTGRGASSNQSPCSYDSCVIYGCGAEAIAIFSANTSIISCTLVNNAGAGIGGGSMAGCSFVNNMLTGNSHAITRTNAQRTLYAYNRTRNNTQASTNLGDWPELNYLTSFTGDGTLDAQDYNNAAAFDFRLVAGSPGDRGGPQGQNIGALETMPASGGGGAFGMMGMVG